MQFEQPKTTGSRISFCQKAVLHWRLQGIYLRAFGKLFNLLEDSGWELKKDDEEGDAGDSDADDAAPLEGL